VPTVLVVDDTPSIRFLIRMNLELAGIDVIEAEDGQDCLTQLETLDPLPDLITIDMVMPRVDGISAIAAMRADERLDQIPIIMVSTQGQQIDLNRAKAAGADEYIIKPFDPDHLVTTVQRLINSRR